jgi:MoaA/NifB/PqqE/SkfB family radical SAM enzyme
VPLSVLEERLVAARATCRGVVLTGGEPTLHRQIVALAQLARRLGFDPIQLQTNGRMLAYREVVDVLRRAGVTEFSPSLHGSTAAVHDGLTRAPGSFVETVAGIRNVVESAAPIITNSVIVRQNLHDLPQLVALLASLGVRSLQLALVHPVGTAAAEFDALVPRLTEVTEPLRLAWREACSRGVRLVTEAVPLCALPEPQAMAVERKIPTTTVFDDGGTVLDYTSWRTAEGKEHGPPCERCSARARCEGPWREYPRRFGWEDLVPFT